VVNALRSITGRSITVPPFFSVTGAYGAAILAREDMAARPRATLFKGFAPEPAAIGTEGHAPARPGAVPSDEAAPQGAPGFEPGGFDRRLAELVFEGPEMPLDPGKKTVGIPRALFTFGMFPMFAPFFRALGFNVLLSGPTSEETVRLAQEYSLDETCYPVKLVNGHVAELVARNVDYIFFPDLFTVHHPGSRARQDHGCAYMQLAFRIVSQAMGLADRGIGLLAPTIAFSLGPEFMRATFAKLGRTLGRSEQETGAALQVAMRSYNGFQARLAERAAHTLENVDPDAAAFVLVSKIYGVADPALNLGVPDRLAALGHKVLSFVDMPETDIFARHPNMYWPFGQHILEAALAARRRPGLYAVLLTHHGCGPDTVLSHYVREIMGPKPYLALEVDEHSSPVGVATRVEAFVHSLERRRAPAGARAAARGSTGAPAAPDAAGAPNMPESLAAVPGATLLLPRLHPYAELLRETLAARGVDARLLPPTTRTSVDLGRRHTATNEYYAMTALLGDVLAALDGAPGSASGNPLAVLLPQNQGAEVDGQYARLVRAKLDELGRSDVAVLAPYMEDLAALSDGDARQLFLCLVAGDVILTAPPELRPPLLETALRAARGGALTPGVLDGLAVDAARAHGRDNGARTVFAVGDPLVLYNDLLNDDTFRRLENAGHHVARAPLAEALWLLWSDHLANDRPGDARRLASLLDELAALMGSAARALGDRSPYAPDLAALRATADATVGLYAGAFGRYREARALTPPPHADGLVTVTSMYENTGISLGILHKGFAPPDALPALHLTFDGLDTENDRTRTDSFLHYLRPHRS
jgi:predicted nucleotide-binding protein (sugar kinase/HSP70/actin superfamily)